MVRASVSMVYDFISRSMKSRRLPRTSRHDRSAASLSARKKARRPPPSESPAPAVSQHSPRHAPPSPPSVLSPVRGCLPTLSRPQIASTVAFETSGLNLRIHRFVSSSGSALPDLPAKDCIGGFIQWTGATVSFPSITSSIASKSGSNCAPYRALSARSVVRSCETFANLLLDTTSRSKSSCSMKSSYPYRWCWCCCAWAPPATTTMTRRARRREHRHEARRAREPITVIGLGVELEFLPAMMLACVCLRSRGLIFARELSLGKNRRALSLGFERSQKNSLKNRRY